MKAAHAVILFVTVIALAGCGGGGGGSSGSSGATSAVTGLAAAPATGPGDTAQLVPMAVGNAWTFDATESTNGFADSTGTATLTVTGTRVVAGVNTTVFALASTVPGDTPYNQFLTSTGGGLTSYGTDDPTDPITNQLAPYVNLTFPVTPGNISHVTATHISAGTDSAGNPLTANADQQVSVAGPETVTVAAGVFANAVKVVTTTSATVTDAATNQTAQTSGVDTTWFAPGVGLVKETGTVTTDGTTQTNTYEARGYTVNGVAHGLEAARTVVAGATGYALVESAAGGGTFMTLANNNGTSTAFLTNPAGDLLASIALPAGNPLKVAFSGGNYLVASFQSGSPSGYLIAIQRISTAGVLLDPSPGITVWSSASGSLPDGDLLAFAGGPSNALLMIAASSISAPGFPGLYGILVSGTDPRQAGQPFFIGAQETPGGILAAAAAADAAGGFLVAWQQEFTVPNQPVGYGVLAERVSPDGAPLDAAPLPLSDGISWVGAPAVAFDGSNYLVSWLDPVAGPGQSSPSTGIWATRVSPAGELLDGLPAAGAIRLSLSGTSVQLSPVLAAFNGTDYLVAWGEQDASGVGSVRGVRLTPSGNFASGAGYEIRFADLGSFEFRALAATDHTLQLTGIGASGLNSLTMHPF